MKILPSSSSLNGGNDVTKTGLIGSLNDVVETMCGIKKHLASICRV